MFPSHWLSSIRKPLKTAFQSRRKPRRSSSLNRRRRTLALEMVEERRLLTVAAYDSAESVLHDQGLYSFVGGGDVMGEPATFSALSGPSSGSLTLYSDGSFEYTPDPGFVGVSSFTRKLARPP